MGLSHCSVGRWLQATAVGIMSVMTALPAAGITVDAPGLNPALLRVTTFADGLNYPVGMAALDDGSILTAVTNGQSYFSSTSGAVLRLADTDGDGVADLRQTLVANVPGGKISALRRAGSLVAVTGQGAGTPISIYRLGAAPADPLTYLGGISLNYPTGGWLHPHSALALRQRADDANRYELYFQLGSDTNFAATTRTVTLSGSFGVAGTLAGDSVHRIELVDGPGGLAAGAPVRIAAGLRNATGMAFHPLTGDLYLGDNGIDGVVDPNEPTSADEINVVAATELGMTKPDFGFPMSYEQYRTGVSIGSSGIRPIAAFQPIPPPNGDEAEGINEIAFAPPLFPAPFENGLFAGFHGRFGLGGVANEENPLAFVDLGDNSMFYVVPNSEPTVGHLDGLLSTTDTLFAADISSQGGFSSGAFNSGKIYSIKSLIAPGDYERDGDVDGADFLRWQRQAGTATAPYAGADGDGNGFVDGADLEIWKAAFTAAAGASTGSAIPEPAAGLMAAVVSGFWAANRRTRKRTTSGRRVNSDQRRPRAKGSSSLPDSPDSPAPAAVGTSNRTANC